MDFFEMQCTYTEKSFRCLKHVSVGCQPEQARKDGCPREPGFGPCSHPQPSLPNLITLRADFYADMHETISLKHFVSEPSGLEFVVSRKLAGF